MTDRMCGSYGAWVRPKWAPNGLVIDSGRNDEGRTDGGERGESVERFSKPGTPYHGSGALPDDLRVGSWSPEEFVRYGVQIDDRSALYGGLHSDDFSKFVRSSGSGI